MALFIEWLPPGRRAVHMVNATQGVLIERCVCALPAVFPASPAVSLTPCLTLSAAATCP